MSAIQIRRVTKRFGNVTAVNDLTLDVPEGSIVWSAGRIFRVALLMQGKGATFGQMVRWLRA